MKILITVHTYSANKELHRDDEHETQGMRYQNLSALEYVVA